jgi:hypothetical protein
VQPDKRLGCGPGGIGEIKAHRWFAGIDWGALSARRLPAPILPRLTSLLDTSNFDAFDESEFDAYKLGAGGSAGGGTAASGSGGGGGGGGATASASSGGAAGGAGGGVSTDSSYSSVSGGASASASGSSSGPAGAAAGGSKGGAVVWDTWGWVGGVSKAQVAADDKQPVR